MQVSADSLAAALSTLLSPMSTEGYKKAIPCIIKEVLMDAKTDLAQDVRPRKASRLGFLLEINHPG